jgi:two-component system cell cycle response regulator DivK
MPSRSPVVALLVHVDVENRGLYAEFLRRHGFLPIPVKTASEGLTVAPHADVVVTETLLPGRIDGMEFIARLKGGERTRTIPVVVLTVCAWPAEREGAEHAGCDVFLTQPCLPDALLREIDRVLARPRPRDVRDTTTKGNLPNERAGVVEAPLGRDAAS